MTSTVTGQRDEFCGPTVTGQRDEFCVQEVTETVCIKPGTTTSRLNFIKRIIDSKINIADNCVLLMRNPIFTENGELIISPEGEALML